MTYDAISTRDTNWSDVQRSLLKIEAEHGMFARVTVPFDGPAVYIRPGFGAPVVKGEKFTVLLCSGVTLELA